MGFFSGSNDESSGSSATNNNDGNNDLSKSLQETQESFNGLINSTGNLARSLSDEITRSSFDFISNVNVPSVLNPSSWLSGRDMDIEDLFEGRKFDEIFDRDFSGPGFFGNFGKARDSLYYKYRGLWAYPVPSVKKYDACKSQDGLSVWDKDGVWRCLFPRGVLDAASYHDNLSNSQEGIVSKEDYLGNVNGAKSEFFENYNDLLGWKSHMRSLQRAERRKRWENRRNKGTEASPSKVSDFFSEKDSTALTTTDNNVDSEGKKIVGTSRSYSSRTGPDGDVEQYSKVLKWFDDGSTKIEETRKVIPKDGSEPKTETNVQSLGPNESDKSGWFWNK